MANGNGYVKVCPDKYIQVDGAGYEQQCCTPCWLAVLFMAGIDSYGGTHFSDDRVAGMYSIRSAGVSGSTFTVVSGVPYSLDDPLHPGSTIFQQTTGTITLTVGQDTSGSWQFLQTVSTPGEPTLRVYIKAFSVDPKFANPDWSQPPEYGLPLQTKLIFSVWESKANVDWGTVFNRATNDLSPMINFESGTSPGEHGAVTWGGITQLAQYYDNPPGAGLLDVNVDVINTFNIRVFNRAQFLTPTKKRTDEKFDLDVIFYNLYTGQPVYTGDAGPQAEVDTDTIPTMALVGAFGGQQIVWDAIENVVISGIPQPGWYRFKNCQFLTIVGTKRFSVWPDKESAHLAPIGFVDFWKIESGPVIVTVGHAEAFALAPHSSASRPNFDYSPEAAAFILAHGTDPLQVRILDAANNMGSNLYNIVPTATNIVQAAVGESGTNYYAGTPMLQGTVLQSAVAGVASFPDLNILGLGRNYVLKFTCNPFDPEPTNFNHYIALSIATGLRFFVPSPINAGVACTIHVHLVDATGADLVPASGDQLTLSGAGSFTGFGTQTPTGAIAAFTGSFPAAGTYNIKVETSLVNYDGPNDSGAIAAVHTTVTVLP